MILNWFYESNLIIFHSVLNAKTSFFCLYDEVEGFLTFCFSIHLAENLFLKGENSCYINGSKPNCDEVSVFDSIYKLQMLIWFKFYVFSVRFILINVIEKYKQVTEMQLNMLKWLNGWTTLMLYDSANQTTKYTVYKLYKLTFTVYDSTLELTWVIQRIAESWNMVQISHFRLRKVFKINGLLFHFW